MSLLCIDAGNSRLKWALRGSDAWLARGVCASAELTSLHADLGKTQLNQVLACNVAGDAVGQQIEALAAALGLPLTWFRSSASACDVVNGYRDPQQLGADRWAALIAARSLYKQAVLVVMAGTATTIDLLDASGRFHGGLILPGLAMAQRALNHNTAGLPAARGGYCEIPDNTADAIASGMLHATLGAIERMAAQCEQLLSHAADAAPAACICLLSGGAAESLLPHLQRPCLQIENLVLEGLAHYAEQGKLRDKRL